uniref:Uncharacterized protein n=1 Tax=Arundo donax TaxID=35708 RepID=A0A0A9ANA1_ARUDO
MHVPQNCHRTVACRGLPKHQSLLVLVLAIYFIEFYIIKGNVTLWSVLLVIVKLTYL